MHDEKIERELVEEDAIWKDFRSSLDYFSKIDFLNSDFKRDVVDAGEIIIFAKDNILYLEKRYEYYEKNKEKMSVQELENLRYEILELMEHIEARLEDVDYFMQKLDSFDWESGIKKNINYNIRLIEELKKFLELVKEKYRILYDTLKMRTNYIKEGLLFLDLEIMMKKESGK